MWLGWVIATDGSAPTIETIARAIVVCRFQSASSRGSSGRACAAREASELVVELRTQTPATMRERLARALGDPTLEVAYRIEGGRYVDASGRPVELPASADRAVTPVTAGGEEVAVLIHDPALLDEPALVESVRATAALVLENERLAAEVRSQLAEVRASRGRIVAAADAERRRIERNLHDGAQQRLVTLSLALGLEASRADADRRRRSLARAGRGRAGDRRAARARARNPPDALAGRRSSGCRRGAGATGAVAGERARRGAGATAGSGRARRLLRRLGGAHERRQARVGDRRHRSCSSSEQRRLRVTVADDGRGGARITAGSGLAGLRDRLEALDATLAVDSRPGTEQPSARSSHASRDRRRRAAHPRGGRAPARRERRRSRRPGR